MFLNKANELFCNKIFTKNNIQNNLPNFIINNNIFNKNY